MIWVGIIIFIIGGTLLGSCISSIIDNNPWEYSTLAIVGSIVLCVFSLYIIGSQTSRTSEIQEKLKQESFSKEWNNGVCTSCGNKLRLMSTPATKYRVYYIYTCDNCGHTIQFEQPME